MKAYLLLGVLMATDPAAAQMRILQSNPHLDDPLSAPGLAGPLADTAPVTLNRFKNRQGTSGDAQFQPEVGQEGKDVIWVPTPDSLVKAMLTVAGVKPGDYVVDLGSGDGRIAIAAARDFGARAHGIEYNAEMVDLARRNAIRAGVGNRATFQQGDIFQTDFAKATVVTMYLLPSLNLKLRDSLLKMKPGTRILSHAFNMGDWEAERAITTDEATGYYWIVPANAAGRWAFEVGSERFAAEVGQNFQMLGLARGGPLKEGRIRGKQVTFTRTSGEPLTGEIDGDQMHGRGWVATRIRTGGW